VVIDWRERKKWAGSAIPKGNKLMSDHQQIAKCLQGTVPG